MQRVADDTTAGLQRGLRALDSSVEVPFETLLEAQMVWNMREHQMASELSDTKSRASTLEEESKRMNEQREAEFQRLLGTNVFDALQRAQDTRYQEIKRYASAWGLDDWTTDYVYRMNRYYEKAVEDYQRQVRSLEAQGQGVDWNAVHRNIEQFAAQMDHAVRGNLSEQSFDQLKQNRVLVFSREARTLAAQ
jgi:hypothetical protein